MTGQPWARFDDLVTGRALVCPPPHRVLVAEQPDDVAPVLAQVDAATRSGAWAYGFLAYEAAAGLDPALAVAPPEEGLPLAWFGLCGEPIEAPVVTPVPVSGPALQWEPDWSDAQHAAAVDRVRAHIAAGETYQCNLTDRLRTTFRGDPEALYAAVALAQRGAHNAYLDLGRHVIASASPELFFDWVGDRLRTRPMKGTAPRGRTNDEDAEHARTLRGSAKERAENVMIVDLLRNDLARVATVGSVQVRELCTLERYPTVWQLTSEITADAQPGSGLVDVFRALFPCGSITGAPKHRSMQVIRALEGGPRGVYCGAVGLVGPPGAPFRARFNVAIRTVVLDRRSGAAVYGAGGGITWDSRAAAERAELLTKAAVLSRPVDEHGLLETLACTPDEGLRHLDRHLSRLADSAAYFGFRCDVDAVRRTLTERVAGCTTPVRVRLELARDGRVSVTLTPLPLPPTAPVVLAVDDDPVDSSSVWLVHKTTRRSAYEDRAARHPLADDVVLVNERGEITETTIANIAVRIGEQWCTPPLRSGCLPGVERGRLVDDGLLRERPIRVEELLEATDVALLSSSRGWRAARIVRPTPDEDAHRRP